MTVLCIETATESGMVVVARDDGQVGSVRWRSAGRHAEHLLGFIETALAEIGATRDELSLIGVDIGPGRFTSLRVGLATAKGLALGLGLPVVGVNALRVLARSVEDRADQVCVSVLNAYRGDVFAAAYERVDDRVDALAAPSFGSPSEVFTKIRRSVGDRTVAVAGEGVAMHAETLRTIFGTAGQDVLEGAATVSVAALLEEVRWVARTAGPSDLIRLEPQYLRPSDAKLPVDGPGGGRSS